MKTIRVILTFGSLLAAAMAHAETMKPISTAAGSPFTAAGSSFLPVMSGRPSKVVFISHAKNLVTNDNSLEWLDVFVYDFSSSNTALVSVNTNGTGGGNGNSGWVSFLGNTNQVLFASDADDLVNNDTNGASDIFWRDVTSAQTHLISADITGNSPPDPSPNAITPLSGNPIASFGRVFFESRATNLINSTVLTNSVNVYVRNLASNTTALVSLQADGTPFTNYCELSGISAKGYDAAFLARATSSPFAPSELYVRAGESNGVTIHASAAVAAYGSGYRCGSVQISSGGEAVAFIAAGLPEGTVLFHFKTGNSNTTALATNVPENSRIAISGNGRYVAYSDGTNLWRADTYFGGRHLVSATTNGAPPSSGVSRDPVMEYLGDKIVFISTAPGLVKDSSTNAQLYSRDFGPNITRLISYNANGFPSAGIDAEATVAIGQYGVIDTTAGDLAASDANGARDVFVFPLDGPVSRIAIERLPEMTVIRWTGEPARPYTVEYTEDLAGGTWSTLSASIEWQGDTARAADFTPAPTRRFYRVKRVP
jgi:hypothetical protein